MEEKRDKMAKMIIALLLILVFGMFGYICYDKVFISGVDESSIKSTVKNSAVKTTNSTENSLIRFDSSKCINDEKASYILSTYDNADGLSMKLSQDKKTVVLTINWGLFGKLSGATAWQSTTEDYTIDNFKQEVEDIYIASFGRQDIGGTTLIYLMHDGTVEYTPLLKAVSSAEFKSYGKIDGIEDVVKFLTADKSVSGATFGVTTLAEKSNGKFYDLFIPLSKTGNY